MEDIDSSPTSPPTSRKRAAPDEDTPRKKPLNTTGSQFMMATPPDTEESSIASPPGSNEAAQRAGSPVPSISTMTSIDDSMTGADTSNNTIDAAADASAKPPPAKRRKLTPGEKLEQQRAREAAQKEKAELKAKKDEEKRVKDEEKRRKAEEREAKRREKDLEEQRKADEKLKKERSQMRLGAFFQKPATPAKSPAPNGDSASSSARRKSLSLEPFDAVADQIRTSKTPTKGAPQQVEVKKEEDAELASASKPAISDYHKYFLPFELPSYSSIAPAFKIPNPDDLAYWQGAFDKEIKDPSFQEKVDLGLVEPHAIIDHQFAVDRESSRGSRMLDIRRLVDQIQGTSQQPIDLTQDNAGQPPMEALQTLSRRYVHFEQDVRPAYYGTYTKIKSPRTTRKLMLNPFSRSRTDTDYDYDSEAEWEEPEEGDDDILLDEDDDAESVSDADEMDGFLDDEEDALKNKRKMITGDLQPTSTDLCWENGAGKIVQSIEGEQATDTPKEMQGMRIGFLLPGLAGRTIDPFSTAYWVNDLAPPALPITDAPRSSGVVGRPPLQERMNSNGSLSQSIIGAAQGEKGPITTLAATQGAKRGRKPQSRTLNTEDLEEFKTAVKGSDLGKLELCKALKMRFPKMTHDTIKETLSERFAQVGSKGEKKWIFVDAT